MKIWSTAFENEGKIPARYTCDGENACPKLCIDEVPENTQCLAIIVDDPDAPNGTFTHWIAWNINPSTEKITENDTLEHAVQGKNDFGNNTYGGPCPPSGTHRYYFKLYALDSLLDLAPYADRLQLDAALGGHVIEQAETMGTYSSNDSIIEELHRQNLDDYTDDRDTSEGQLISS